jgi:hypothetical protein
LTVDQDVLVVGCQGDADLLLQYQEIGWTKFVTEEFLFMTALKQELDIDSYVLKPLKPKKRRGKYCNQ